MKLPPLLPLFVFGSPSVLAWNAPKGSLRRLQEVNTSSEESSADMSSSADGPRTRNVQGPSERDCEYSIEDDKIEFECKAKDLGEFLEIKDEIKFTVAAKGEKSLKVKVEYEQEIEETINDQETETETETQYEITFDRVVEYRKAVAAVAVARSSATDVLDINGEAYDWEKDIVVQEWVMEDWNDFTAIEETGNLSRFSVSTADGIATFSFTIAKADTGDISANKMKIDFELKDFPWASDNTYVALLCSIESTREVDVEYEDMDSMDEETGAIAAPRRTRDVRISFEDATEAVGFVPFGEYTWKQTADVIPVNATNATDAITEARSTTIEVIATSPAANTVDDSTRIAFSFVGEPAKSANDIYWDPEAGINYVEGTSCGSSVTFASITSVSYMVGLLSAWVLF